MGSALRELRDLRNDPEYLNFIAVGEALKILSGGLRHHTEQKAKELQKLLLKNLGGFCNCHCTSGVKPCRHTCKWGKELEKLHQNKRKSRIPFYQSDSTLWHDPNSGYWEIAKVFMHDLGAKWSDVKDPATTDLTGLLNFLIFCKHIKVEQKLLMSVRDLRNDWAHTKNYKLSASRKQNAFIAIDNLMNDPELLSCKEVQDCRPAIDEVKNADVSFVQERDLEVLKELTRYQQLKRETELMNMIRLILLSNNDNHQQSYTSQNQFIKSLIYLGIMFVRFLLLPVKECNRWKPFSLLIVVMSLLSCVSDDSVFLSDHGCSRPVKISPVGFNEFDFKTTHLSFKRDNFFGRSWFFGELHDILETLDGDQKGVLITGDPGSGKSALMSQLICSTFSSFAIHSNIIGFHVCDFSEVGTRDGSSFVRNLVDQIASNIPAYAKKILDKKQLLTHLDKRCARDPTACFSMAVIGPLRELKIKSGNFKYIVIDALDECIEKDRETSVILDILRHKIPYFPPWLKVIMSSRNWTTVTSKVPRTIYRISLNPHDERNIADIRSYVSRFLRKKASFVSTLWNTISEVTDELTKHSDGNFLFVKTVLQNNLGSDGTIDPYSLPNSLHDIYDQIFQRYFVKEDSVRFETLFEILVAAGSLHETEIYDILRHQNQGKGVQTLLAHVSSLLHFGSDGSVSIYHQSFAEWLINNDNRVNGFSFQKRRGHAYITDYLFELTKDKNISMTFEELFRLCVHVLNSGGPSNEHKKQLTRINVTEIRNQQSGKCILHELAQMQNGSQLLEIFLPNFSLVDVLDFNGKTPAYYAALGGFVENSKSFIYHGTCATCILHNVSSVYEIKAAMKMKRFAETSIMHAATYYGHTELVGTLLKYNASFIEFNEYVPTLLHVAAERGHLDLVKLLYNNGDKADKIALHHAAARNHFEVVKYLLENAGVKDECLECKPITFPHLQRNKLLHEIHNMFCETALHAAVSKRHNNMTKLLLKFGNSAIECKHYSGKTPLMDAVERNDTEMTELLLQNSANVEEKCGDEISVNVGETSGVRSFYGKRSLYTVYREKTSCPCGSKALHLCAKYGLWHMAKYLIKNWKARVFDKNCNGESVWKMASLSHNQDFIYRVTWMLLDLDDQPMTSRKSWKMGFKQLRTFEKLLKKFSMKKKPFQSSFQCDSTFDGMSPLHIAALMGVNMLNRVYKKAHEIAPSLSSNCTNKHWITPRYLAHFYDSIPALTDESPTRLKQTPRDNNEYTRTMLQYPDREAEFHMIYNYFYDSLDDWKYYLFYEDFKKFEDYGIANCPGYYDMPTKESLEPSCDRYDTKSETDTDEDAAQSMLHEIQECEIVCIHDLKHCEDFTKPEEKDSTKLEKVTFSKPDFKSSTKEMQELMEWEEYMIDCGCPKILNTLHELFTAFPKQNRYVNQFISERMGWKETSSDGEILKRWPIYFFHKKLKNEYQSYKYLDILNEGFKIKMSIEEHD